MIRLIDTHREETCRDILGSLPEWFGIPEAVDSYARLAVENPVLAYTEIGGRRVGFVVLKVQTPAAMEVAVMGVLPDFHRKGIGRALIYAARRFALDRGAEFLTVKTLAPAHPDPGYAKTRAFYEAVGFRALEILPDFWGRNLPCLMSALALRPQLA